MIFRGFELSVHQNLPECLSAAPNTKVQPCPRFQLAALLCSPVELLAAGRALLSGLAGSALLAQPALAQESDAVDSAVANLTEAVKVGCSCMA